jgi:hypothetical protein
MTKFASLSPPEQEKLIKEYKALSVALKELKDKLGGKR